MTREVLVSDLTVSEEVKAAVRARAARLGLPPADKGVRFAVGPVQVFWGRRADNKLKLLVSAKIPDSYSQDADYHELHGCVCTTRDAEIIADSMDELLA